MGDYLKPPEQVAETILRYLQELGCEMGLNLGGAHQHGGVPEAQGKAAMMPQNLCARCLASLTSDGRCLSCLSFPLGTDGQPGCQCKGYLAIVPDDPDLPLVPWPAIE